MQFIVETHSEAMVNRLGALVREGKISATDIQLIIFRSSPELDRTTVSTATYDNDGALQGWPFGFFSPAIP